MVTRPTPTPRRQRSPLLLAASLAVALLAGACTGNRDHRPAGRNRPGGGRPFETGLASWYGEPFHGRRTANGEIYDMNRISAAHKTLPFGTRVRVDNLDNGRSLVVRINDRGPFVRGRIIDLSLGAARELDMVRAGVVRVRLTRVEGPPEVERSVAGRRGPFTVQVGAFLERRNAEALQRSLVRDYPEAMIEDDGRWHRVRIPGIDTPKRAEEIVRELRRGGSDAFVAP